MTAGEGGITWIVMVYVLKTVLGLLTLCFGGYTFADVRRHRGTFSATP